MILDYGELDKVVKPLVGVLDHHYLVSQENINAKDPYAEIAIGLQHAVILGTQASTGEMLSHLLLTQIRNKFREVGMNPHLVESVRVDETPKSTATYYAED
jgi:6-pyruvoyl-tetrahydropterin synthase